MLFISPISIDIRIRVFVFSKEFPLWLLCGLVLLCSHLILFFMMSLLCMHEVSLKPDSWHKLFQIFYCFNCTGLSTWPATHNTISNAFSATSNISLDIWFKDDDNVYKTASHKDNVIVTVIVLGKSKHVLLHSLFMDYFFIEYFAIHLNWTQLNWECR